MWLSSDTKCQLADGKAHETKAGRRNFKQFASERRHGPGRAFKRLIVQVRGKWWILGEEHLRGVNAKPHERNGISVPARAK